MDSVSPREQAEAWRIMYRRALNVANSLTNYVEDRPELGSAERALARIQEDAHALDAAAPAAQQPPDKFWHCLKCGGPYTAGHRCRDAQQPVADAPLPDVEGDMPRSPRAAYTKGWREAWNEMERLGVADGRADALLKRIVDAWYDDTSPGHADLFIAAIREARAYLAQHQNLTGD